MFGAFHTHASAPGFSRSPNHFYAWLQVCRTSSQCRMRNIPRGATERYGHRRSEEWHCTTACVATSWNRPRGQAVRPPTFATAPPLHERSSRRPRPVGRRGRGFGCRHALPGAPPSCRDRSQGSQRGRARTTSKLRISTALPSALQRKSFLVSPRRNVPSAFVTATRIRIDSVCTRNAGGCFTVSIAALATIPVTAAYYPIATALVHLPLNGMMKHTR